MESFNVHSGVAVPIDISNCDTDQIIPARYLRRAVDDPAYASFLLHDLRYEADGTDKDFVLNRPEFSGASIIVANRNWGCGSSRENAVTALLKNGFKVVIAPSFGDIHYTNCVKRGVLPVRLSSETCTALRSRLHAEPGTTLNVDLETQIVSGPGNWSERFDIESFDKMRLQKGLDDTQLTLEYITDIDRYERDREHRLGWINL